jgi:hypothetical protein
LTENYITAIGPCGGSSIRSRRHDLTICGLIIDSGKTRLLRSGRMGTVWKLK